MKESFRQVYEKYSEIDIISRKLHPDERDILSFNNKAKEFSEAYADLSWAQPNNQMHALTEHTNYYLQLDGVRSLGKLSTEGNEAGNRRFKTEKRMHTFTGSVLEQMNQSLRFEWLSSCSILQRTLITKKRNIATCSACKQQGHYKNSKMCPMFNV